MMSSFDCLSLLAGVSLKSLAILLVTFGVSVLARRAGAATRHLIWAVAVVSLVGLPLLTIALPNWNAPISAGFLSTADASGASVGTPPNSDKTESQATASRASGTAGAVTVPPEVISTNPSTANTSPSPVAEQHGLSVHWSTWVLLAWGIGALVVLFPCLFGIAVVWRLTRRAGGITSENSLRFIENVSELVGLKRPVNVRMSGDTTIPLTWGFQRPVLLLPAAAEEWSAERLQAVILHEFAHIKRGDWVLQILSQIACAIYWFNPLVWIAANRLRTESERAADDWVLATGFKASDYADHLLQIIRSLKISTCRSIASVAMARPSGIERRIVAILDAGKRRHRVTRVAALASLLVTAAVLLPLAAMQISEASDIAAKQGEEEAPSPWKAKVDDVTIELVGISSHPSTAKSWWKPDGSPLAKRPYARTGTHATWGGNYRPLEFVIRVTQPDDEKIDLRWDFEPGGSTTGGGRPMTADGKTIPDLRAITAQIEREPKEIDVRIGVAASEWETWSTRTGLTGHAASGRDSDGVAFAEPYQVNEETRVTVADSLLDQDHRVIVIDQAGNIHKPSRMSASCVAGIRQTTVHFRDLKLEDLKELRFQVRPYEWVEFKDVALEPRKTSGSRPQESTSVFLPDIGHAGDKTVLDLKSGTWVKGKKDPNEYIEEGKGDLAWDQEEHFGPVLICLRNSKAELWDDGKLVTVNKPWWPAEAPARPDLPSGMNVYLIEDVPSRWVITTAEGTKYVVEIQSSRPSTGPDFDNGGIEIEYAKLNDVMALHTMVNM